LKWKHYLVRRPFADDALQSPEFTDEIVRVTRDALSLLEFVWGAEE
jgi:uncharacterized protein (DUF2461 family)